jgi:methyltransferase (TIGR00027 family)
MRRAAHQLLDRPSVFDDPLAVAIAGAASEILADASGSSDTLRAFVAVRSRYAEDELAKAVGSGVRQYVVLGAGLDTFVFRNPHAGRGLRVFEVDHPSTQNWKLEQVKAAGIHIPPEATFVPLDFEKEPLTEVLEAAGLSSQEPVFFSWLGVVPYLTDQAFMATLEFIAARPPASGVVFDYGVARSALTPSEQIALDSLARRVAAAGEPFRLFFEPHDLAIRLREVGFRHVEDLGSPEINARYFADRADGLRLRGPSGQCAGVSLLAA